MHEEQVTLASLADGAAMELFQEEFQKVLENIGDVNTDPRATREVCLKVKIKPNEAREVGGVTIDAASKLAPVKKTETVFYFGKRNGRVVAVENNPKQLTFDDITRPIGVVNMRTGEIQE